MYIYIVLGILAVFPLDVVRFVLGAVGLL